MIVTGAGIVTQINCHCPNMILSCTNSTVAGLREKTVLRVAVKMGLRNTALKEE